jgi:hypothetical protein
MPTKKTTEQRLAELNEQQAKIEGELKKRRASITRRKRQQQAKLTNQKRKENTRRKLLDGELIQRLLETNESERNKFDRLRDEFLKRDDDRALFGFPPLPKDENDPENEN